MIPIDRKCFCSCHRRYVPRARIVQDAVVALRAELAWLSALHLLSSSETASNDIHATRHFIGADVSNFGRQNFGRSIYAAAHSYAHF